VRVLKAIAGALNLSAETLLTQAGLGATTASPDVEAAVAADERLTAEQKQALLGVYRSYLAANAEKPRARGGRARGS
jgi:hypothetical protein